MKENNHIHHGTSSSAIMMNNFVGSS